MRASPAGIIAAMFLSGVAATFESAMLYAALPTLIRDFGDPVTAGWLVTMHMLVGAATCIVVGRLGDMRGRKGVILVLIALAAVGSVMSALATNYGVVLTGRALQGFSIGVLPLSMGILRESLSPARLPVAIGLMTTAQGSGVAIGLILGGAIGNVIDTQMDYPDTVVASAIWHFEPTLQAALANINAGSFTADNYGVYSFLKAGGCSLAPLGTFEGKVPGDALALVAEREAAIRDGSFTVEINDGEPASA